MYRLFVVPYYIFVWYSCIFVGNQVFQPDINHEGKGAEPHVGNCFILNVSTLWDSMVMSQILEGVLESWYVEDITIIYDFSPSCTRVVPKASIGYFPPFTIET